MMPGEDGLSLCRHIREHGDLPVILLTAKSEETDRIVGLEMGADDYVLKPFSPRELVARIKAIFCRVATGGLRQHGPDSASYAFDTWVLKSGERRSEEHTSELQSLMRISYAVFCLKKKKKML